MAAPLLEQRLLFYLFPDPHAPANQKVLQNIARLTPVTFYPTERAKASNVRAKMEGPINRQFEPVNGIVFAILYAERLSQLHAQCSGHLWHDITAFHFLLLLAHTIRIKHVGRQNKNPAAIAGQWSIKFSIYLFLPNLKANWHQ
jgi:hypothetical protein